MEGTDVASLATAERRNGLADGARPRSRAPRVVSTSTTAPASAGVAQRLTCGASASPPADDRDGALPALPDGSFVVVASVPRYGFDLGGCARCSHRVRVGRRGGLLRRTGASIHGVASAALDDSGGNGKGATATVTWCGFRRGEPFEGFEERRGEGPRPETRRTPGSAAGCNRPASRCAEQAVEVVRNHVDGTCGTPGSVSPKGDSSPGSGRAPVMSMEGRPTNPTRGGASAPALARALRRGSEGQEGR
jgi:hypothetical protein